MSYDHFHAIRRYATDKNLTVDKLRVSCVYGQSV